MKGVYLEHGVLAICPFSRGFSFVLFDGPDSPFEWGIREIKEKQKRNAKTLAAIKELVDAYFPMAVVIEELGEHSKRGTRIRKLNSNIGKLAEKEDIGLYRFSYADVCEYFFSMPHARKRDIRVAVTKKIPGFAQYMPPKREAWMSQHPRESLFDAAALGLTFYGVWDGGQANGSETNAPDSVH